MVKFCVCMDGSEKAHAAFLRAISLCKPEDTIITLVVVDFVHYMMSNPKANELTSFTNMKQEMLENGDKLIKTYEDLAKDEYNIINYSSIKLEGNPRDMIMKVVDEQRIDVLLLGVVGLMNGENISMGSTSNFCIRNCHCDVLLCK
ncbi:hypothetical protein CYY_004608 [Polysphondylium violaceum]|uniref:UspA domain-containing protein n=1 Tax=Polysphondylium violaceum TaxID=133409 RepID=A0A8J4PXT4_9MYCE|nr:hypothetical protein CYY_004608 [Polysphondylium violaceum]